MGDEKIGLDLEIKTTGVESVKELRQEIKDIQSQMLKVGEGSAEFKKLANMAAQAKDRMGDLNEQIERMNPDKKFQGVIRIGESLATGFTSATAAAALFGIESEDVQKTLLKVQATTAALQGIQSIFSAPVSPAQILALAIGALVTVMGYFSGAAERANKVIQKQIDERAKLIQQLKDENKQYQEQEQLDIQIAEARGASIEDIRDMRIELEKKNAESEREFMLGQQVQLQAAKQQLINLENEGWIIRWGNAVGKVGGASAESISKANESVKAINDSIKEAQADIEKSNKNIDLINAQADVKIKDRNQKNAEDYKHNKEEKAKLLAEDLQKQEEGAQFERELFAEINQVEIDGYHVKEKELDEHNKLTLEQDKALQEARIAGIADGQAKEIAAAQLAFEQKMAAAQGNHDLEKQLIENFNAEVAGINQKYQKSDLENTQAVQEAKLSAVSGFEDGLVELGGVLQKEGQKQGTASKVAAGIQLGVDTAAAIGALTQTSERVAAAIALNPALAPSAPFIAAGMYAAGVIRITKNLANARKLLGGGGPSIDAGGGGSPALVTGSGSNFRPPNPLGSNNRTLLDDAERRRNRGGQQEITVNAVVVETDMTNSQKDVAVANSRAKRKVR